MARLREFFLTLRALRHGEIGPRGNDFLALPAKEIEDWSIASVSPLLFLRSTPLLKQ
jgi:hypothetical protein